MQVSIPFEKVTPQNVFFTDKKKNVIIDGHFIKILYSNEYMELNGIYITFPAFSPIRITKPVSQINEKKPSIEMSGEKKTTVFHLPSSVKYTMEFNPLHPDNMDVVNQLCNIERTIIRQYILMHAPNKIPLFNLHNQLTAGVIKIQMVDDIPSFSANKLNYLLKISGVWETNTNVGITVKFIHLQ